MLFKPLQFLADLRRGRRSTEDVFRHVASQLQRTADISAFRQSIPALTAEMARARRYKRPLAVVMLGLANDSLPEHVYRLVGENGNDNGDGKKILSRTTQLVSFVLGFILRDALRESDIATYSAADDRYILMLAESTRAQAQETVQRLNGLFYQRVYAHLRAGIAEFPDDGLTLDELVSGAQQEWHQRPVAVTEIPVVDLARREQ